MFDYKLRVRGLPLKWKSLILGWQPGKEFCDTQLQGPYALWHHTHGFTPYQGGTLMTDKVYYKAPLGLFGEIFATPLIKRDVKKIFAYRQDIISKLFLSTKNAPSTSKKSA